ncbi:hypothetical protein R3P38DRAFT_2856025 [Favolaschia claudopus]|uniref:Uncharacterized protein n=1 Tax=Favolaschia claudopus TaxID=2862362 RepID=A0AAW0DRM6_9AGAR
MSPSTLSFRSFFWVVLVLSGVAHAQALRRAPALYFRQDGDNSQSASRSSTGSPSSSGGFSSSSVISTSSKPSSSSAPPSSSFVPPSSSSKSTSTTTSSSSSTTTSSSSFSSSSAIPSSSSAPESSSRPLSSSTTPRGAIANPTQTNNFLPTNSNPDPTDTGDEPEPSDVTNSNVNAASSGFWGNKGKVGATFTIVALVIVGILASLVIVMRRRNAAHNSARDTFFDTKTPADRVERQPSPEPSMTSLRDEPMDAHSTPMPNYGLADQYLVDTNDYVMGYPPGAAYAPAEHQQQQQYYADNTAAAYQHQEQQQYYSDAQQQQQYYADPQQQHQQYFVDQPSSDANGGAYYADSNAYENYNHHYSTGSGGGSGSGSPNAYGVTSANQRPSLSPHPYSHPSHASGVPPSAFSNAIGRDSYQPSIDSFYGAAGTAR